MVASALSKDYLGISSSSADECQEVTIEKDRACHSHCRLLMQEPHDRLPQPISPTFNQRPRWRKGYVGAMYCQRVNSSPSVSMTALARALDQDYNSFATLSILRTTYSCRYAAGRLPIDRGNRLTRDEVGLIGTDDSLN
jgi:hypothetical protein